MQINLGELYGQLQIDLREAELKVAELRGQIKLIERMLSDAQRPQLTGDLLEEREEVTNGYRSD